MQKTTLTKRRNLELISNLLSAFVDAILSRVRHLVRRLSLVFLFVSWSLAFFIPPTLFQAGWHTTDNATIEELPAEMPNQFFD